MNEDWTLVAWLSAVGAAVGGFAARLMPFRTRLVRLEGKVDAHGERMTRIDSRVETIYEHLIERDD